MGVNEKEVQIKKLTRRHLRLSGNKKPPVPYCETGGPILGGQPALAEAAVRVCWLTDRFRESERGVSRREKGSGKSEETRMMQAEKYSLSAFAWE